MIHVFPRWSFGYLLQAKPKHTAAGHEVICGSWPPLHRMRFSLLIILGLLTGCISNSTETKSEELNILNQLFIELVGTDRYFLPSKACFQAGLRFGYLAGLTFSDFQKVNPLSHPMWVHFGAFCYTRLGKKKCPKRWF